MDETQISITVKPIYFERLLYWIIIIVLAVLLAIAWLKDDTDSETIKASEDDEVAAQPSTPPVAKVDTKVVEKPLETCVDGVKNQDESDIDCGGVKCDRCENGLVCKAGTDCESDRCILGKCTTKVVDKVATALSNKIELDITNVAFKEAPNGNVKITEITYKVTNGLEDDMSGMILKVYAKNKDATRCLNQQVLGTCDEPYVEFSTGKAKSGESITNTYTLSTYPYMGPYLLRDTGYDPADATKNKFQMVGYLYDDAGNEIDDEEVKDSYLVTP